MVIKTREPAHRILLKACPICHGDLEWDKEEQEWVCLQAGHRFPKCSKCGAPAEFFPDFGPEPICAACWDSQVEIDAKDKVAARRKGGGNGSKNNGSNLPSFPEFDESWPNEVKVAWLNSYAAVIGRNN